MQTKEVVVISESQPYVLQQRMKESNLKHGDTVKANIPCVRIEQNYSKAVIFFCPVPDIEVKEKIAEGDGGSLPDEVTIHGLKVPAELPSGLYNLKNINLHSNGTLQVIATEETIFECGRDEYRHNFQLGAYMLQLGQRNMGMDQRHRAIQRQSEEYYRQMRESIASERLLATNSWGTELQERELPQVQRQSVRDTGFTRTSLLEMLASCLNRFK